MLLDVRGVIIAELKLPGVRLISPRCFLFEVKFIDNLLEQEPDALSFDGEREQVGDLMRIAMPSRSLPEGGLHEPPGAAAAKTGLSAMLDTGCCGDGRRVRHVGIQNTICH